MSSKIDRALKGPSWTEVTIGALLSVIIGVVLAATWLILKPVEKVRELPKEPVKGVVYFIEGSSNSTQGRMWQRKQQAFMAGQSVSVNEQELNTAARTMSAEAAKAAKEEDNGPAVAKAGSLNFRIDDGQLQIATPVDLNLYGLYQTKVQIVAQGAFERSGDKFAFKPSKLYIGSCRVDNLPVVGGMVLSNLAAAVPDDLKAAWGNLENVTIEGSELQLVMQ